MTAKLLYVALMLTALSIGVLALQGFLELDEDDRQAMRGGNPREKAEFAFSRLRYRGAAGGFGWWATDFPKSDRQFVLGVKRLTRVNTRATENFVDIDSDDVFNWPWIYVEFAGGIWSVSDSEARRLRDYMMRGGFVMLDDIHGPYQFQGVIAGVRQIFPDRELEELPSSDPVFQILYELDERLQVPGTRHLRRDGSTVYPRDSVPAKWFGIRDDKGRVILTISHNSDVGDAWEWADSPYYPERYASFAYRWGINQIVYAMTH